MNLKKGISKKGRHIPVLSAKKAFWKAGYMKRPDYSMMQKDQ
jgi:hypothetical protein